MEFIQIIISAAWSGHICICVSCELRIILQIVISIVAFDLFFICFAYIGKIYSCSRLGKLFLISVLFFFSFIARAFDLKDRFNVIEFIAVFVIMISLPLCYLDSFALSFMLSSHLLCCRTNLLPKRMKSNGT